MTRNQIIIYLKCIQPCVKLLSKFINNFPYLISTDNFEKFQQFQNEYKRLIAACRNVQTSPEQMRIMPDIIIQTQQILQQGKDLITDEEIASAVQTMIERMQQFQSAFLNSIRIRDAASFEELQTTIETLSSQLLDGGFNNLMKKKLSAIENLKPRYRTIRSFVHANFEPESYTEIKAEYRMLARYKACLEDPERIACDFKLPHRYFLTHEQNLELWFLINMLKPDFVFPSVQNYKNLLAIRYQACRERIDFLKDYIANNIVFTEIVRTYRTIYFCKKWSQHLSAVQEKVQEELANPNLQLTLYLRRLMTYEKAAFFRQHFKAQRADHIIDELYKFVSHRDNVDFSADALLAKLKDEEKQILTSMRATEAILKANQTTCQQAIAELTLAITQLPAYQLGTQVVSLLNKLSDASNLPILAHPLPDALNEERIQTIAGIGFLGISLGMLRLTGYSYYFIATINNILFAHIDLLTQVGEVCDKLAQRVGLPLLDWLQSLTPEIMRNVIENLKEVIRFDRVGVAEKEKVMRWLSGLGVNLMMARKHMPSAAIFGYTAATTGAMVTDTLVKASAIRLGADTRAAQAVGSVVRAIAYPQIYKAGYRTGISFFFVSDEIRALRTLGLVKNATETEIHRRYRELAFLCHPDRPQDQCKQDMAQINKAYKLLMKKRR
jgi:hypothetical protein